MPDLEIIQRHISERIDGLARLQRHSNATAEQAKRDPDLLWILERGIYLVIQNLLDMLAHIASSDFKGVWASYSDIGDIFQRHEIISEEDKNLLNKMAIYRNMLSHEYFSLDSGILLDIVNNHLSDFTKFQLIIMDYCKL